MTTKLELFAVVSLLVGGVALIDGASYATTGMFYILARTHARAVRKLSATLGIPYRALPNGEFNRSTVLILLDPQGRIVARTAKLGTVDAEFVKAVKSTLQGALPAP